ncbi:StAR-related lipid transfer protein 7, mitochondrial [Armadillidium nasatum]|uniref:Phosphatidylcholine transfer protein n=1 Tax=Armadillidium nasatum TaxID=96803 RepID=A0A5N5SQ92_9CRUS|nr:StAR-related lipid transfer protein 7, mitochondrial [Armadillidium nasatum]
MNNIDYCMCKGSLGYTEKSRTYDSWEPFLERKNILVWRRNHHKHSHLYSYKVYGTYDDMSLNAFMEVQLNSSFRTQWDTTALQLQVVDSDPESNSDLLYWLVKFPHFFANRDYIFRRRFKVNKLKKEVVIFSEVVDHSQIPEKQGIHRVKEYWSIMVLKANENFNKPGMSYTLTYFDNPGTSLPAAVTNFVASTAFPDFLTKVYEAAMSLQRRWENGEDVYVTLPPSLRYLRKPKKYISEVGIETIPSKEIAKLQDYSVFTGDSSFVYNEKKVESEINEKFSLRFKKVVIDLLEAIEVVSPEYEEKTILTQKIEQLVDKLGITNSRKHKLVKKLQALSVRTKLFVERAAEKKQESFKIMNEFERKHYYDNLASDEPNILQFVGLLLAINEILKVDKDMRTGKDLAKIEKKLESECLSKNSESNLTSAKQNPYNNQNFCECCEQYVNFSDKIGWYKYILSLLTSNPTGRNCVCSHKVISSDISNNLKPNGDFMNGVEKEYKRSEEISSWFYLSWVFGNKTENIESTENENEEHVSWQFWTWIYNFMFRGKCVNNNNLVINCVSNF